MAEPEQSGQLGFTFQPAAAAATRRIWTPRTLMSSVRTQVEREYGDIWVEGEISNFRPAESGHLYFTLKDDDAQLRVVMFRTQARLLRFRPENGLQVVARGRVTIYEARGELQLSAEYLEPKGVGALQIAFEQLKAKLQAEGLFDPERKKPVPALPKRIGIVTSPRGAAIQDILNILRRRHLGVNVVIYPAQVQGEAAAAEVSAGIRYFNRVKNADVIILARGGGSMEDLAAFNDEALARAIADSRLPLISAVGHETDFTIADFVADMRAPTPSAAAEIVAAHESELCARLGSLSATLARSIQYRISGARNEVQELALSNAFDAVAGRVRDALTTAGAAEYRLQAALREALQAAHQRLGDASRGVSPMQLRSVLMAARERFGSLKKSHEAAMTARIDNAKRQLALSASSLDAMSPLKVLERGYAIAHDEHGRVIREAATMSAGDKLRLRLWKGELDCRVE